MHRRQLSPWSRMTTSPGDRGVLDGAGRETDRSPRYQLHGVRQLELHREINLHAGAPRLLLKGTLRLIRQHFYALVKAWAPVAQTGHRAILAAFEANDSEAARLALRTGI